MIDRVAIRMKKTLLFGRWRYIVHKILLTFSRLQLPPKGRETLYCDLLIGIRQSKTLTVIKKSTMIMSISFCQFYLVNNTPHKNSKEIENCP